MAKRINNLRVFVASPSDIGDERVILEQVVKELNKLLGEKLGLRLDLVKWETDTYPSFGNDAQSVINEQIGDDYDIFIGMLWKRFGTPTIRGESGTIEEFNRAYKRALENPYSIRIMFYFNDSPVSFSEIEDVDQYKSVISFRKSIGKQGVYYWSYKKAEDFSTLVRLHLGKVMQDFGTKWGQGTEIKVNTDDTARPKEELADKSQKDPNIEEGFLDLIISSAEDMKLATESINRIGTLMQELNKKTVDITAELNQLSKPINPNVARPIINRQADIWESFAQRANGELPILSTKFRSGINSYIKATQIMTDFETKDRDTIQSGLDAIAILRANVIKAKSSTKGFITVVQVMPRMTTRLNHAKRLLVEILDKIVEEYETEESLSAEAEKTIISVLQNADSIK